MLKINCFLYAARVQDSKQREAYLSMWESRKQLYLPLIKPTKTQYKEGGEKGIKPASYTCSAINTTYSSNPSVLEIIQYAILTQRTIPIKCLNYITMYFILPLKCGKIIKFLVEAISKLGIYNKVSVDFSSESSHLLPPSPSLSLRRI